VTIAELLERLDRVRRNATGWVARCPAHEDRTPSLSVAEGDDGRVLLGCHAGCATGDVCSALGITEAQLFSTPARR
jgi:putative DNA primase/helicase